MAVYHQCELKHDNTHQIAWIEARGAVIGASVAIKGEDNIERFWQVLSVGYPGISKEQLVEFQNKSRNPFPSIA